MQQVSAEAFASAVAIDPSQLPALLSAPRRRPVVNVGLVWVLHRRRVLLSVAVVALLAGVGVLYGLRDRMSAEAATLYDLGERELAHSPLGIQQISMTGQAMSSEQEILAALDITPETSMVNFDADAARTAIESLPPIASATVRKAYPNHLYISVQERVPVGRWRVDGVTYLIDPTGAKIAANGDDYPNLPLVIGDSAGDDAMVMIRALNGYTTLTPGLEALSRIADRRWDMIYRSGLRVQLPEQGVGQALNQLATLQDKFHLLDRDVTVVDLRVAGVLEVTPSDDAVKQLAAIAKSNLARNKSSFKEDADYSAPAR